MKLEKVIHYKDTNSVEATWVNGEGEQVKCHSYSDIQMQMFREDVAALGGNIGDHEAMIAEVEAGIAPVQEEPSSEKAKKKIAEIEFSQTPRRIREALLEIANKVGADCSFLRNLDANIAAERAKIK